MQATFEVGKYLVIRAPGKKFLAYIWKRDNLPHLVNLKTEVSRNRRYDGRILHDNNIYALFKRIEPDLVVSGCRESISLNEECGFRRSG